MLIHCGTETAVNLQNTNNKFLKDSCDTEILYDNTVPSHSSNITQYYLHNINSSHHFCGMMNNLQKRRSFTPQNVHGIIMLYKQINIVPYQISFNSTIFYT